MSLRYRNLFPLVAVCLALAVAPAPAAKSAPTIDPVPGGPTPDASITAPPCEVGQNGPDAFTATFVFPPDDQYYTLLDPSNYCPGGATLLSMAHVRLYWPANCTLPVQISIVGSTGGACPQPDQSNIICPAVTYIIDGAAAGGGNYTHDLPLSAACCISGPAYLKVEFPNAGSCTLGATGLFAPRLVAEGVADFCVSYKTFTRVIRSTATS